MAKFRLYKLHFTSPFHINDQRSDDGTSQHIIHSDVLYAALISCLAKYGQPIPNDGELEFTVTSLFPYYQASSQSCPIYFLPIPLLNQFPDDVPKENIKALKKVKWVDATLYESILAGNQLLQGNMGDPSCIQGVYYSRQKIYEDNEGSSEFVHAEVVQRVKIEDRTGRSDAVPYYVERITFADEAGLYFLAQGDTAILENALNLLSVEGIGSDRNVGFGYFNFEASEMEIGIPENADHVISLSFFIPESEEQLNGMLDSEKVAYDFIRRSGWITTPPYNTLRKNAIYGFMPGSVFCNVHDCSIQCLGKIVDLSPNVGESTPNHPIWRNGKSIMLPIKCK